MATFVPLLMAILAIERPPAAQLPVAPPPRLATDAELDKHLAGWKKESDKRSNLRVSISITLTEFKQETQHSGYSLWMQPNLSWICDGKSVFHQDGLHKTICELPLKLEVPARPVGPPTEEEWWIDWFNALEARMNNPNEHIAIKCLTGSDAVADKQRYRIELARVDANYIYLEIHPLLAMDKQFCEKARIALFAPNTKFAYLPASVGVTHPGGQIEVWKFTDPQINIPGVTKKDFQYSPVPGFKLFKAETIPPAEPSKP